MKYKFIPGTNIEIPCYSPLPVTAKGIDREKLAKNAECIRYLNHHFFGKANSRTINNTSNLNVALTVGGVR